jgi:hypothetical protein
MKKILVIMIAVLAIASGSYAQKVRGFYRPHTRVIIAPAIGFTYGGYGYPYFGYPYFGYPYNFGYSYNYGYAPSRRLDAQIAAIRADYAYKIKAARRDKSVPRAERKQNILALKSEREQAIANAAQNFRNGRMNGYHQNQGTNNQPLNNSQNQGPDDDQNS